MKLRRVTSVTSNSNSEEPASVARARCGQYVIFNNGYFSLASYPWGVRCRLLPRWATREHLGTDEQAKKQQATDFVSFEICCMTLRAWMLCRSRRNPFLSSRAARQRWWDSELAKLRLEIQDLNAGPGTTGCPTADRLISQWAPLALGA